MTDDSNNIKMYLNVTNNKTELACYRCKKNPTATISLLFIILLEIVLNITLYFRISVGQAWLHLRVGTVRLL